VIIFVILGVLFVLVLVILYFVLAAKPTSVPVGNSTLKPLPSLKVPLLPPLPEQHVLRIAVDWPPRPPPNLLGLDAARKTGCNRLQAREQLHYA
jgi:hypothetical protein